MCSQPRTGFHQWFLLWSSVYQVLFLDGSFTGPRSTVIISEVPPPGVDVVCTVVAWLWHVWVLLPHHSYAGLPGGTGTRSQAYCLVHVGARPGGSSSTTGDHVVSGSLSVECSSRAVVLHAGVRHRLFVISHPAHLHIDCDLRCCAWVSWRA